MDWACTTQKDPSASRHWRGVIEDFIDLNPANHSFQCLLKHTENVLRKVQRTSKVDAAVKQGVIPSLVKLLQHEDLRQEAILQTTAVAALVAIVEKSEQGGHAFIVAEAGAVPFLLNLLYLRQSVLASKVLHLLDLMTDKMDTDALTETSALMEGILEVTSYGDAVLNRRALECAMKMLGTCSPPLELSNVCIQGFIDLLKDQDTSVLLMVWQCLNSISQKCTDDVAQKIMSKKFVPIVIDMLKNSSADPNFIDCVQFIISSIKVLVCRNLEHAQVLVETGFLPYLEFMLNFGNGDLGMFSDATWILACFITRSDAGMVEQLLQKNLMPSIRVLLTEGSRQEQNTLAALLQRLFQIETYVSIYLDKNLLEYMRYLKNSEKLDLLGILLAVVGEALEGVKTQGTFQEIGPRMLNTRMLEVLFDLQNCSSQGVRTASAELVQLLFSNVGEG